MDTQQKGAPEPMAALNKIKIIENGEPLVDIRAVCPAVTVGKMEQGVYPFLRLRVAEMLNTAASLLPPEYHLYVVYALRDVRKQKAMWELQYSKWKGRHPEWPENIVRRAVNRYVAPVDQAAPPGHCTGGAVDVVLQTKEGEFVDVVPPLEDWSVGHTWTEDIDPEVRATRMVLVEAMLSAGFSNCRDEYWHYSWGDSAWAVRTGASWCPYGAAEPPL